MTYAYGWGKNDEKLFEYCIVSWKRRCTYRKDNLTIDKTAKTVLFDLNFIDLCQYHRSIIYESDKIFAQMAQRWYVTTNCNLKYDCHTCKYTILL